MTTRRWIFEEPSEEDDEPRREVALLGGMAQGAYSLWDFAEAFKTTGDILVDLVLSGHHESYELVNPILYNYRHAIELYLKFIVTPEKLNHNLHSLLNLFIEFMKNSQDIEVPKMYKSFILELHDFDADSTTFRYPSMIVSNSKKDAGEFAVDLSKLKDKMDLFQISFRRIARASNLL